MLAQVAGLVFVPVQSVTQSGFEALADGDFETAEGQGFQAQGSSFDAVLVDEGQPLAGPVFSGRQAIDLGVAGRSNQAGYAALLSRVLAFSKPGVLMDSLQTMSYWWKAEADSGVNGFLHHYLFVDLNQDGQYDGCLFAQPTQEVSVGASSQAWRLKAIQLASQRYSNGFCTADADFAALPGVGSAESLSEILDRPAFADAELTHVMLRLWSPNGTPVTWPEDAPVYVDRLSLSTATPPCREPGADCVVIANPATFPAPF